MAGRFAFNILGIQVSISVGNAFITIIQHLEISQGSRNFVLCVQLERSTPLGLSFSFAFMFDQLYLVVLVGKGDLFSRQ